MAGTKSNTKAIKIRTGLVTAVMILLAIISLLPIYVLIVNATRASVDITGSGVSLIPHLKLFENIGTLNEWASSNKVQYNALHRILHNIPYSSFLLHDSLRSCGL